MKAYQNYLLLLLIGIINPIFAQADMPVSSTNVENKTVEVNALRVKDIEPIRRNYPKREIVASTKYFDVKIKSTGASVTSFLHKDDENPLRREVELVDKNPFDFVIYQTAASLNKLRKQSYKLSKVDQGNFVIIKATTDINAITDAGKKPLRLTKVFKFHKEMHYWEFYWEVKNLSRSHISFENLYFLPLNKIGPAPEATASYASRGFNTFYFMKDDFETKANIEGGGSSPFSGWFGSNDQETEYIEGKVDYFGMSSRFMILAVQPLTASRGLYEFPVEVQAHLGRLVVKANDTASHKFLLYAGPKVKDFMSVSPEDKQKYPEVKNVHEDLYKAFDFGFTEPIRELIVVILKFFYTFIPNYGVGIILFALFFKLIFFPLNQAQAKSMKKMQALQPKLKVINEKYKDNPQEKQKQTIQLYKKHKANPLGGCLPMIIQIPIFIALYSAFSNAYELWGAPFITGWIDDLSKPDTIYTIAESIPVVGGINLNPLPVIMVASQFLQMKLTTVSGDSNQQKMMMFLPFIMLFFFWNMPSGVVLYWIVFNVFSVLQQVLTKTDIGKTQNA